MKNTCIFYNFCRYLVFGSGILILSAIWGLSLCMTQYNGLAENEIMYNEFENPLWNLFFLIGVCLIFSALGMCMKKYSGPKVLPLEKFLLPFVLLAGTAMAWWWVQSADRQPYADQAAIYGMAGYILEGDFQMFQKGGYLNMYPQQLGLIFIVEWILRIAGIGNYQALQYLNVINVPFIIFWGYMIVDLFWKKSRYKLIYLMLMLFCIPLYLYSSWVYGEIPSIAITLMLIWLVGKYITSSQKKWIPLIVLCAVLDVMVRTNTWIVAIGAMLVLAVTGIKKRRAMPVLTGLLVLAAPWFAVKLIWLFYEWRTGYMIDGGLPSVLWIAMGLHWDYLGPGWFNNYCVETYYAVGGDQTASSIAAKEYIWERLAYFASHIKEAVQFFGIKISTQWNDPMYQSLQLNTVFKEEPQGLLHFLCYGAGNSILKGIANRFQFLVFTGGLICVGNWHKCKDALYKMLPIVIVTGGFLFSLMWEAKSRYIFPYFVFMIPCAAAGLGILTEKMEGFYKKTAGKLKTAGYKKQH